MYGIFLDLETSGLDVRQHRILEVALRIIDLEKGGEIDHFDAVIKQPESVWEQRDLQSIEVNGFTWDRVSTGIPESEATDAIIQMFKKHRLRRGGSVFICQNPSFDRAFLSQVISIYTQEEHRWPYHWLDLASMFWALDVRREFDVSGHHPANIPLSKDTIAEALELPPEEKPHRAMNGVDHLILCYNKLLTQ